MNILLTGSGGFIGWNLKNYLLNKYNVLSPRSYELDMVDETGVEQYFNNHSIDFIIHCASVGGVRGKIDENDTLQKNLKMVENLIKFKKDDTRIILFGSGAMYDKSRNICKVKESEIGKFVPKDLYGLSKMKISEIVLQREDILCLNIFGCYGYREKASRFPSYAINQSISKEPIIINQDVVFDYLFIDDLSEIVNYFIKNKTKDKIINVTPSKSIKLSEISEIINEISDCKSEIILKNKKLNNEYTGDNSILLDNIKGFEFTPIKVGLEKLYNYIKNNKNEEK